MDAAALPPLDGLDVEGLKALLIQQHEQYCTALSSNAQHIEHLKLVIDKLRRRLFGTKSEKVAAQLEQLELELEELETAQACDATMGEAPSIESAAKSKPFRKPLPEHLPREVVTHHPEQPCCPDCGGALKQFSEDISEQLERIPATFKVIRHVRPKFRVAAASALSKRPLRCGPSNAA